MTPRQAAPMKPWKGWAIVDRKTGAPAVGKVYDTENAAAFNLFQGERVVEVEVRAVPRRVRKGA